MATHRNLSRLALHAESDPRVPHGAWWPASRSLGVEMSTLLELWPVEAGRILRVLYSPPDWDDRPRSVTVGGGRRIKTGCFPDDDTRQLTLSMMDGTRRVITVIAPDASPGAAADVLAGFATGHGGRP